MDFPVKPIHKDKETYWMHELRTIFPYSLNDRIGDEFKTDNKHINAAAKFSSWPRKHSRANRGKNHKGVPFLLAQQFLNDLNHILNISINYAPTFISFRYEKIFQNYPWPIEHKTMWQSDWFHIFHIVPSSHRSYWI